MKDLTNLWEVEAAQDADWGVRCNLPEEREILSAKEMSLRKEKIELFSKLSGKNCIWKFFS